MQRLIIFLPLAVFIFAGCSSRYQTNEEPSSIKMHLPSSNVSHFDSAGLSKSEIEKRENDHFLTFVKSFIGSARYQDTSSTQIKNEPVEKSNDIYSIELSKSKLY